MRRLLRAGRRVLRGAWRWFGIAAAVTFCGTLSLPTLLLTGEGRLGHRIFARGWGRFILRWCGVRLEVEGLERLDVRRPCVIAANHVSHYGFYAAAAALPLQWRAVIRAGMRRIPIFGYVGEKAGHIFVRLGDREQARADLQAGIDRLREGYWLLVFPEGRPAAASGLWPFKQGAFRLAIEAGVPVVPLALAESYAPGEGRAWDAAPRVIRVIIGPPVPTIGLQAGDAPALAERVRQEIGGRVGAT